MSVLYLIAPSYLTKGFQEIEESERIFKERILNKYSGLSERMCLITSKTLYPILNNIRGNKPGSEAAKLKKYLVAENPGVRYDTTKVVEAIIRIRYLGSGIPVLRIDWDALLNQKTLVQELSLAIRDILDACEALGKDHCIRSYMISGSYEMPSKATLDDWDINDFNTSFATRMFPALILPNNVSQMSEIDNPQLNGEKLTELSRQGLFDREVMKSY